MTSGLIFLALLALPLLIALGAFLIDHLTAYGLQGSGIAKHRRLIRAVGFAGIGLSALAMAGVSVCLIEIPV